MTINFLLNREKNTIKTDAEQRLIDILRDTSKLSQAKSSCYSGFCGLCLVIFNGDVVKSCLIPAFKIIESDIITIEGFSLTVEYNDIIRGFSDTGVENCGLCNSAKILTAEALLAKNPRPCRSEILMAYQDIKCRCTEPDSLVNGILAISEMRQKRLYGNRS